MYICAQISESFLRDENILEICPVILSVWEVEFDLVSSKTLRDYDLIYALFEEDMSSSRLCLTIVGLAVVISAVRRGLIYV